MKTIILYPSDYFNTRKINIDFESEFLEATKFIDYQVAIYNHDEFMDGGELKLYPPNIEGLCICRTWMFHPDKYDQFYNELHKKNITLINTPQEYANLHIFPNVYPSIIDSTPKAIFFKNIDDVDISLVNKEFTQFIVKDYVKSVKGTTFPSFISTPISLESLIDLLKEFIRLRGELYTGGIVLKEFVQLKKYGDITNEYRAFFLKNKLLTLSKNSNQTKDYNTPSLEFVNKFSNLDSNYYTVDFAELEDGSFILLETGDGQVSGLSANQIVFKYYENIIITLKNGLY